MKISESSVKVGRDRGPRRSRDSDTPGRELNDWDRPAHWADEYAGRTDTWDQRDARGRAYQPTG